VRLVVKGHKEKSTIDYFGEFSSITQLDTIHMLISFSKLKIIATYIKWTLSLHFLMARRKNLCIFLNGTSQKIVYVEQPTRYIIGGIEDKVYILNKV